MEESREQEQRIAYLADEVLRLSRNTLLVHLRFLDSALSRLVPEAEVEGGIGTDGRVLRYNPKHVLQTYYSEQERMTRDYLHLLLHCTFRHAFIDPRIDRDCWDLAADIAVECAIDSMALTCVHARRQEQQQQAMAKLLRDGVLLTAEKLYRYFKNQNLPAETLESLRMPFFADDHDLWYTAFGDDGEPEAGEEEQPPEKSDGGDSAPEDGSEDGASPSGGSGQEQAGENAEPPEEEEKQREQPQGDGDANGAQPSEEETDPQREEQEGEAPKSQPKPSSRRGQPSPQEQESENRQDVGSGEEGDLPTRLEGGGESNEGSGERSAEGMRPAEKPTTKRELKEQWNDIARHMLVDMETGPKTRGDRAGAMLQNLKAVTRETYDYSDFLRQFAVPGEAVQINDDEFDYIYYTYGLSLYGKMPLVEPLEYKEVRRIREFVIAIDTSGSVKGDQVQRFIQKTYNILMEQESFFTKINLHIIQCDAAIQEVHKIETREDFDAYLSAMTLKGFGGTDFRPVFAYIGRMLEEKEFTNLKGLIYFTDGQGVYPAEKPPYDAAFVFVRDDYEVPKVPVWAIRLLLDPNDL